jgi:multidrug efflux pump subunit AcrA (membrane-fusion protein)
MKVTRCIIALAGVVVLTGCHNKQPQIENIVTVKTARLAVRPWAPQQNYAGSIEEQSGTMLSFATAGTIKALYVHEGQNVAAGQS